MTDQKITPEQIEKFETKVSLGLVVICHFGDWITQSSSLDKSLEDVEKEYSSAFLTSHIDRVVEDWRKWGTVAVLEISESLLLLDYREDTGRRAAILLEVATIQDWFSLAPESTGYYIFDDEDIIEIRHDY